MLQRFVDARRSIEGTKMQIRHTAILKKGGGLAAGETSAYQQTSTLFLCSINFYRNEIPNFGSLRVELFEMAKLFEMVTSSKWKTMVEAETRAFFVQQHS